LPTYGYECTACKDQFEIIQRITEEPLAIHEGCGGELRRLLYPVGIVFKGPGFHINDYSRADRSSGSEKSAESKPEAGATKTAEPKPGAGSAESSASKPAETPKPERAN
jgi:putative FmdB family regulatory protein